MTIRGIGTWTLQMLGLTGQGRLDQLPAGDLGYLKFVGRLRSGGDPWARATEEEVMELFAPYAPWAGLAGLHALRSSVSSSVSPTPSESPRSISASLAEALGQPPALAADGHRAARERPRVERARPAGLGRRQLEVDLPAGGVGAPGRGGRPAQAQRQRQVIPGPDQQAVALEASGAVRPATWSARSEPISSPGSSRCSARKRLIARGLGRRAAVQVAALVQPPAVHRDEQGGVAALGHEARGPSVHNARWTSSGISMNERGSPVSVVEAAAPGPARPPDVVLLGGQAHLLRAARPSRTARCPRPGPAGPRARRGRAGRWPARRPRPGAAASVS